MDLEATRSVAVLSSALCCASLLTVVSLAVILTHWHDALDACAHADCGCLLYARVSTSSYAIQGSDVSLCWFSGAAPLPGLVFALSLAAWYGYRGFVRVPASERRAVTDLRGADGSAVRLVSRGGPALQVRGPEDTARLTERIARAAAFTIMQGVACLLLGLLAVSHVAVLTDGFLTACREYRHAVLKTLRASGNLAQLVNDRLSCPVIFDFLDYMKPDAREVFQDGHWFPGQRALATVNTSAALVISLVAAYSCMVLWFALAYKFGTIAQGAARRSKEAHKLRKFRARVASHCTDL
ncbi:uncharacterized protein LOC117647122 [Thrips palmi]|uniref:Uncharacterized protein LOC117647122 n=1 Tax=Thrips palmi TaxID=161013 RepID=A0A6P8ZAY9_THRPL|nr:uncharacterized protein LOC117647122 [Thrips palmi]